MALVDRIAQVLNEASAENGSDTPDYILAGYLLQCLDAYDRAVRAREAWFGRKTLPADPIASTAPPPSLATLEQVSDALRQQIPDVMERLLNPPPDPPRICGIPEDWIPTLQFVFEHGNYCWDDDVVAALKYIADALSRTWGADKSLASAARALLSGIRKMRRNVGAPAPDGSGGATP